MDGYLLSLADKNADLNTVGGKGMSLARLARAGLPVPDGFHINTAAYRYFVAENDLQSGIAAAVAGLDLNRPVTAETAAATIRQLFAAAMMPADLAEAITAAYAALPGADLAVAVRSSATAEDLPEASFAGQQETYLNVRGAPALLVATQKCWASLWTARAISYRARQGLGAEDVALAVIVQELVPAEAAGVLFTANPLNGQRGEAVINAAWGLGEAVVSGAVTPDTIVVDKAAGRILSRETATKLVMTVRTASGTEEVAVPAAQQKAPVLTDAQALALSHYGNEIEALYGLPMDIEWTLWAGQLAIVQARPITALPALVAELPTDWPLPDPKAHYARGSLAEHTPSPVSPLFATMGLRIANEATERLWVNMIGADSRIMFVKDGFYMPINNYVYAAFRFSPKAIWLMVKMSVGQFIGMMKGSVPRYREARGRLAAIVADWEQKDIAAFADQELLDGARAVFAAATTYYTVIQTTLPAASMAEIFFQRYYNWFVKRKDEPAFTDFLFGFATMPVRAEQSLFDIAGWVQTQPTLAEYLLNTPAATLLQHCWGEGEPAGLPVDLWQAWLARLAAHFDQFGHTAYEFDFANPTPAEQPNPQLEAIKLFLTEAAASPYERQTVARERRETATAAISGRLDRVRRRQFQKLLTWAQETGAIREDSLADMGLGHPVIRRMLALLGERLAGSGAIQQAADIYWLEEAEIEALIAARAGGQPLASHHALVETRQAEWRAAQQLTAPVALPQSSFMLKLIAGAEAKEEDGKLVLKGLGTGTGQVTAPACVLHGPDDFSRMKPGDVLVATTTTPAWTPLFVLASAVVTDIGGPLSHSSIVAREYGIPAVMAARNATHYIRDGQMVRVDGAKGTVTLEPV